MPAPTSTGGIALSSAGFTICPKFYKGNSGLAEQAANGWELASIITLQSGTPFSVLTNDTAFVQAARRFVRTAILRRVETYDPRLNEYFNTACFAAGDYGFWDETGETSCAAQIRSNVDISIIKYFPIGEREAWNSAASFSTPLTWSALRIRSTFWLRPTWDRL